MNERYNGVGLEKQGEYSITRLASLFSNEERAAALLQEHSSGDGTIKTARGETVALKDLLDYVTTNLLNRHRSDKEVSQAQKPQQLSLEILRAYLKGQATDDFFNQLETQATAVTAVPLNMSAGLAKRRKNLEQLELERDARDSGIPEPDQRV